MKSREIPVRERMILRLNILVLEVPSNKQAGYGARGKVGGELSFF